MNSTHKELKGQLEWARVVYPIATLTWDGVKETARKFKDLEVDTDGFYVLYKDEENEQIVVKNEADMVEAINWAAENGNLLELIIPNASDNDSDWDVLYMDENRESPRVAPVSPQKIAQSAPSLDLDEEVHIFPHVDSTELVTSSAPQQDFKSSMLEAEKEIQNLQIGENEEEKVQVKEEETFQVPSEEEEEEPSQAQREEEEVDEKPEEVQKTQTEMGELKRKQDELSDKILDEFVSRLMAFATVTTADEDKYKRMLKAGVPQEAVSVMKNVDQNKQVDISKYARMAQAGVPQEAIDMLMEIEGVPSQKVFDALAPNETKYNRMLKAGVPQGAVAVMKNVDQNKEVDFSKYSRMAQAGVPQEAIDIMMEVDGFPARKFFDVLAPNETKYKRMLKAGVPQGAVSVMKNVDQSKKVDFSKYSRMAEAGVPQEAIDIMMQVERVPSQKIFNVLSSKRNVEQVSKFIQNEKVQNALVAISKAETEGTGRGGKTALAKLLVVAKECVELIKEVPEVEDVIMDFLNSLRVTPVEEAIEEEVEEVVNRVRHPNVHCDACDGDVSRATDAFTKQYRNEAGEILGDRYKSAVKPDFDLCTLCEAKPGNEDARPFLKIVDPTNAPEIILCALPGATQGMMTQVESLDWRNPIAREFGEFIQQKQQQAFRAPPPRVIPEVAAPPNEVVTNIPAPSAPAAAAIVETVSFPQAKFVADVTLADGSVVRPGEVIKKTWRIRNSGDQPWPKGVRIAHVGGDAFGGPIEGVEVPLARAGEAVNVTVPLVMPQQPGRYTSYWRMLTPHPSNSKFGHRFWVTVNVVAPPSAPPTRNGVVLGEAPRRPSPPAPPVVYGNPVVVGSPTTRVPPPPPPPRTSTLDDISPELVEKISQLTELGFSDIDKIVSILKEVNGDSSLALDRLLAENQ